MLYEHYGLNRYKSKPTIRCFEAVRAAETDANAMSEIQ